MCIWAQPSPTGSTPDSYVVSLPGVEYVTVRARFTTRAPASPSRPRTTTAPTTPYAVHTPISLVPRLAERGLPSDAVEADRRIGQPQVREPAADQPQVRDPGVRRVRIGPPARPSGPRSRGACAAPGPGRPSARSPVPDPQHVVTKFPRATRALPLPGQGRDPLARVSSHGAASQRLAHDRTGDAVRRGTSLTHDESRQPRTARRGRGVPSTLPAGDTASPAQNPSLSVRPVVRVVANVVVMWLASR